uniref:Uncharacterized protein n=1 Tax=Arundo donax TaxID=35708 RepID=A0A0A9CDW7_ARUDO
MDQRPRSRDSARASAAMCG